MRFTQPTPEQAREWVAWVDARPEAIRSVARRFDPWTLYRLASTGQRVYIRSFAEPGADGKVTCRIGVTGEFNLVTFERDVFGIDPDDLTECDLPGPDEILGTHDFPIAVLKDLRSKYPEGAPADVMQDLRAKYPLKRSNL